MTYYFNEEWVNKARKRKNILLSVYFITLAFYLLLTVGMFIWYKTLPYKSPTISTIKCIHYPITAVFVLFSFIYLMIPFWRARAYYLLVSDMKKGKKEKYTGVYLGTSEEVQDKSKVDMKHLTFSVYNKYKNENFERKVLVFADKPFPEIKEGETIDFYTQSNVLFGYETHKEI